MPNFQQPIQLKSGGEGGGVLQATVVSWRGQVKEMRWVDIQFLGHSHHPAAVEGASSSCFHWQRSIGVRCGVVSAPQPNPAAGLQRRQLNGGDLQCFLLHDHTHHLAAVVGGYALRLQVEGVCWAPATLSPHRGRPPQVEPVIMPA